MWFRSLSWGVACLLLLFVPLEQFAQSSSDIRSYIERYKKSALQQEKEYGIPASITLAQGILESGAGTSQLTVNSHNHFGIKAAGGWNGPVYLAWDDEVVKSRFRVYSSADESYRDHALFLRDNPRYASLFTKSVYDYRAWAIGLQKAGYASAANYAKVLIGYIDAYRLYAINGGVKLRAGKTVVIQKSISREVPIFNSECQMDEDEESDEQVEIKKVLNKYLVEINDVRCTILLPGEQLSSIVLKYGIPKQKLLEFNEISVDSDIQTGDIVFLNKKRKKFYGPKDFCIVKEGDTLYTISQKYGIRLSSLSKMNGKNFFSNLCKGERILLK